jgi:ankyrin repeat protein
MLRAHRDDVGYFADRADGLLASARDGTASAVAAFTRHGAPLSTEGARAVVAAEHGQPDWAAFTRHLAALGDDAFAAAHRAIVAHDVEGLRAQLDAEPGIVRAQAVNGNDLLAFATGAHDERLVTLLLERGADVNTANVHGWTALHQAAYGGLPPLVELLLAAGADPGASARGDGGTPLIVALFWGHRAAAERLARERVTPANLRAAAGLGRLELAEDPGAHRAFYRPHGGFPAWTPSDDPQEVLDEALSFAARNDRSDALEQLVARGADVAADVYRGTALAWAAATGRAGAIRTLVALGADPDQRTTFGGSDHGDGATALHLAAQGGHRDAVAALLEAGADRTIADGIHGGTPAGWAEFGGHPDLAARLR